MRYYDDDRRRAPPRRTRRRVEVEDDDDYDDLCIGKNCPVATTGALQILIGVVSIVVGIVVLTEEYNTDKTPVGMPVWAGGWVSLIITPH